MNEYNLSRPVGKFETIDFFVSHSWHDDPDVKWNTLEFAAHKFKKRHSRDPTFWLDKVCIDQSNIQNGLKVLPVNVMACSKMLVLCGSTYPSRLWCAWELFTLFSFEKREQALDQIELMILDTANDLPTPNSSLPGANVQEVDIMQALETFEVGRSSCFDPNEVRFDVLECHSSNHYLTSVCTV